MDKITFSEGKVYLLPMSVLKSLTIERNCFFPLSHLIKKEEVLLRKVYSGRRHQLEVDGPFRPIGGTVPSVDVIETSWS